MFPMSRSMTDRIFESNGRIVYYRTGIKILKRLPWFGLGSGNYAKKIHEYIEGPYWVEVYNEQMRTEKRLDFWMNLHNAYLQNAVDYGLIGFLWWLAAMSWLLYPLKKLFTLGSLEVRSLTFAFMISILAFLLHNLVDILFTHSLDLLFVFFVVLT
jgi:O-antigen ligase